MAVVKGGGKCVDKEKREIIERGDCSTVTSKINIVKIFSRINLIALTVSSAKKRSKIYYIFQSASSYRLKAA